MYLVACLIALGNLMIACYREERGLSKKMEIRARGILKYAY